MAWGTKEGLDGEKGIQDLITDNLPRDVIGYGIVMLFSLNLFFSFPLVLYPAHIVIETILYSGWEKTKKRQWSKNFTRTLLVGVAVVLTIGIGEKLNKFLSIAGALTCSPIAFTFPALFHYNSCADTP